MRIVIEYDSCWQASLLEKTGNSKKRSFNKLKDNFREISDSTVLGVLYRLIGDQRGLKEIQKSDNAYFSKINVTFSLNKTINYKELVALINKSNDRCSDGKYIGVIRDDNDLFFSRYAPEFWSVLYLSIDQIIEFIINPKLNFNKGSAIPLDILARLDEIQDFKSLETIDKLISKKEFAKVKGEERLKEMLANNSKTTLKSIDSKREALQKIDKDISAIRADENLIKSTREIEKILKALKIHFPDVSSEEYLKKGGEIKPIKLYCAALYLQADLLEKSGKNIEAFYRLQKKGINKGKKTIQGFSKKGFNGVRDFLNPLSTGGNKKAVKTPFELTKASGQLEIEIPVDREQGKEIQSMIENAGVSSFYLGKKGLAYVSKIRV